MPPRKTKSAGPTTVDAITHHDKRANLPTADAEDFVAPEIAQAIPVRYPRDPTLDPQLVWKGKDELDGEDLVAQAPPIYIQEKIDPRVLIENLRDTAARPEEEPELTLFETFDGLDELDLVEFYEHDANWSNRMILGDSLNVMASLAEREALRGKVQMIYIDPPYGIKFGSNWQVSARNRDVTDGKIEDVAREVEQIKAFRDTWELGIHSYLTYMRDRVTVARDLLTQTGSVFVQISNENQHLVRCVLDEVFGSNNAVATIVWRKASPDTATIRNAFNYLLWYALDIESVKTRKLFRGRRLSDGTTEDPKKLALWGRFPDGSERTLTTDEKREKVALPPGTQVFRVQDLAYRGVDEDGRFEVTLDDGTNVKPKPNYSWRADRVEMTRLQLADRVMKTREGLGYKFFNSDSPIIEITNWWEDTAGNIPDKTYVVQTLAKIIERCVLLATDPGDLVLDPTCGSGTTAYVAEQWGRRWITTDTSRVALALARQRLMAAVYPFYVLSDTPAGRAIEGELSGSALPDAETTGDIRHGFVYDRVQRITLKAIANNPDVEEGMSREEVDVAIRRHAERELLYDKPHEDKKKVRVAGPFTVESLSPHRSLAFAGSAVDGTGSINADAVGDSSDGDASFEQSILANLRTAGIQNGRKNERLTFDTVDPYAATYVQAVGERDEAAEGTPKRVGITIGPQYGTVGPSYIKDAAREANRAGDIDLLCVLAFAFDPTVLGANDDGYITAEDGFASVAAERRLGKVPVLLVRMNADLVMGEDLKKTGAGNLFTVFGEPDIEIATDNDLLRVILHGVDVYDPNTGETRSKETDQIALWMIDTAYNGESFFVRHCYFTGGQDLYKRLKQALKADIDADAWASLYTTESRPFPRPASGRIAVKVINDYGDEVMKVFDVGALSA
jgi:adenine-specific DNA-methyltransferase